MKVSIAISGASKIKKKHPGEDCWKSWDNSRHFQWKASKKKHDSFGRGAPFIICCCFFLGGWSSNFDFIEFSEQLHDNSVFFETCSKLEDGAKLQHASQRKDATKKRNRNQQPKWETDISSHVY